MKKLLLATAAIMLAGPALAADLPRYSEPAAPAYAPPAAFNWTGFYAGANIGYGWGDFRTTGAGVARLNDGNGFGGGVQVGYNMQYDPLVVGIEGEIGYANVTDEFAGAKATLGWRGSVTPRVGYAFDRFLPYIKAGFAGGNVEIKDSVLGGTDSATAWGWTAGVGAEYAVTNNVSIRAEYNYTDLGREDLTLGATAARAGFQGSDVRLGVNYKF
jgi:outer membrane immunogenic protein